MAAGEPRRLGIKFTQELLQQCRSSTCMTLPPQACLAPTVEISWSCAGTWIRHVRLVYFLICDYASSLYGQE